MWQRRLTFFSAILLCIFAARNSSYSQNLNSNVLILGWDGCQREHLKEMMIQNEVPNLKTLAKEGALVNILVTKGNTDTKAGWTQILTGYPPEITGVYSDTHYKPVPPGLSIFERVENALGKDHVFTAMIAQKNGNVDKDGPKKVLYDDWYTEQEKKAAKEHPNQQITIKPKFENGEEIIKENGKRYIVYPGKPYYFTQNGMDSFTNGLDKPERVVKKTIETLEKVKEQRFLIFVHFSSPDHEGHEKGENSEEYTNGIKSDDLAAGQIILKLKELGIYNKTLVYITADHGFDEGKKSHANAPYIFLATNDKQVKRDGDRLDIAPTVLKRFRINLATINPPLSGKPLDE